MGFKNGWTERVRKDGEEIRALKVKAQVRENLIDAMKIALATREELIEDTITDLQGEKKTNLSWQEFAHSAVAELKAMRELAGADEIERLNFVIEQKDMIIKDLTAQREG